MKASVALLLLVVAIHGFQRTPPSAPKSSPLSEQRADTDLRTIVGFGPRPAGSEALAKARSYIVSELSKAGLKPQLDEFDARTPKGFRHMVNIRAMRSGLKPTIIALTGHYDTKVFDRFFFTGANDGGSSAAWLLEFARATERLKIENTLEFVVFDGEEAVVEWTVEDTVYGSRHDLDRRYRDRKLNDLKAMILVDMIGDRNLNIRQERQSTSWLKNLIWDMAHLMGYTNEFPNEQIEISDDHVPYLKAAIPSADLIDFDYPCWHQACDTLDKVSAHSLKIVGDVVYFSLPEIDRRVSQSPNR